MTELEGELLELRREYATRALAMASEDSFKLILKEVNRSRFFLQEAVDSIPRELREKFLLEDVNILQELTRESLIYVFAEERTVLGKLKYFLNFGEPQEQLREQISRYIGCYIETLAKLHGLFAVHKLSGLFDNGYKESN